MVAIAGISIRAICEGCKTRSPHLPGGSAGDDAAMSELAMQGWSLVSLPGSPWERHVCPRCNGSADCDDAALMVAVALHVVATGAR